jgi:putative ABC transport system substrate-binding protein
MRRRDLITLLGGAAAWPFAARAQQPVMPVIGFLNGGSPDTDRVAAFRRGLTETGYVEGRNVAVEYRWAQGQYEQLPALAAELIHRPVAVLAATTTPAALAAKAATTTVPTVFTTIANPVELGLVASLSRPGGNITGATQLNVEIGPKLLQLVRELIPTATVVGLLVNPTNPTAGTLSRDLAAAARTLRLELHVLHASMEQHLDEGFASPTTGQRTRDRCRCILQQPERKTHRTGSKPSVAGDLRVERVRLGRWPDQLCEQLRRSL